LLDENKLKQDIKATKATKATKAMAANKNKFTLPNGWTTETKQRTTGKTAGQKDIFYISPDKQQKFNSLVKVEFFIKTTSSSSSSSSSSANVVSSSALELATALANVKKYQEEAKKYQDNLGQIQICYQQYAEATTLKDRTKFEHDMRHFIFKLKISEENTKKKIKKIKTEGDQEEDKEHGSEPKKKKLKTNEHVEMKIIKVNDQIVYDLC